MTVTWKGMICFAIGVIALLVIGQLQTCEFLLEQAIWP